MNSGMRGPVLVTFMLLCSACPAGPTTTSSPNPSEIAPPLAKRAPQPITAHGDTRIDDYYWLRERDDPEVLAYLEAENAYTEAATADQRALRTELLAELSGRIAQVDDSVPVFERGYWYTYHWLSGAEHPVLARREGALDAPEQVVLDADALAEQHPFFELGDVRPSESSQLLAYAVDTVGRRFYTVHVADLANGALLADEIPETGGTLEWAADDRTLYYVKQDPETLRHFQVLRHTIGEPIARDELVYEERDETFDVDLRKSKGRDVVLIEVGSTLSDEVHLLDSHDPDARPQLFAARERGLEYGVDQLGEWFYVLTNLAAPNFRVMRARAGATGKPDWREVVGHRDDVLIEDLELFDSALVLETRHAGLTELSVHELDGTRPRTLAFAESAHVVYAKDNVDPHASKLRFVYQSMTTPPSTYDYDLQTGERTLLRSEPVLGGFDPANYVSERIVASADDGTHVPISVVRRRTTTLDGHAPLLLYAYGSYGASEDPLFSQEVLSLLDRGFVFAIAHVRGGAELGRAWYEAGKLLDKRNSFTDFIDCAEHLIATRYADPKRVFAQGGSAGGLLVGAVVNMRPDLFAGVIAEVPFVDVVTTMLDDSIPLTTAEYDEWGNPNDERYYRYMLSYSPYDNVAAMDYPAMLVTAGLHDSQVQYWEPAKWVAKLRARKTDSNLLLLRTDMRAGHGGASGRLAGLEDVAFEYAFLLSLAGGR
jgi:oligopeptidase B